MKFIIYSARNLKDSLKSYLPIMKKLEIKDLKIGDLVKLRDGLVHEKRYGEYYFVVNMSFKGFRKITCLEEEEKAITIEDNGFAYTPEMIAEVRRPTTWTIYKYETILDDVEKEYLSSVIRPFRNEVKYICKERHDLGRKEFISFTYKGDYDYTTLKQFKAGTMYKGMEANREYTLEELGL